MNVIIIAMTIVILSAIIGYTVYKLEYLKKFNKLLEKEIDFILDKYNKYEQMVEDKDENYWRHSVDNKDFVKVLKAIKRFWNN